MAKYDINIANGTGSQSVLNGTYAITSNIKGYDNTTIDPSSVTFDNITNTLDLTIAGSASLTLHVSENGTSTGTAIVGATFQRCNEDGSTNYGSPVISDSSGNALFEHFPYDLNDGVVIYYKQIASDGEHEFDNTVKSLVMDSETKMVEIVNTKAILRIINVTDKYYSGLTDINGVISFN